MYIVYISIFFLRTDASFLKQSLEKSLVKSLHFKSNQFCYLEMCEFSAQSDHANSA